MRLGLYGGTFDPIHLAHLLIGEQARQELNLDRVIYMPSYISPHKRHHSISSAEHRLKMAELATQDNDSFFVSDYEIHQGGTSFTVHTLRHLHDQYNVSSDNLFLIIGADNLNTFNKWKQPDVILQLARLAVAGRPAHSPDSPVPEKRLVWLDSPLLEISASAIRQRLQNGVSIRYWLPESVRRYIFEHGLYKS